MSDLIYYCVQENNNCQRRNKCKRYLDSDSHSCRSTLYKSACTDDSNKILFIEAEHINTSANNDTKEDDLTE